MTGITSFENAARGSLKSSAVKPRVIEKTNETRHSGAHSQNFEAPRDQRPPRLQVELVCQDETQRFDPFWDGPRLIPSFVAQVLGQAMPAWPGERREGARLETAYGACAPRQGLLLDRKS